MNLRRINGIDRILLALTVNLTILVTIVKGQVDLDELSFEYPGPYCAKRGPSGCCKSRQDSCSLPISTTLCYCDEFCKRGPGGDCCPDYPSHCLNLPPLNSSQCTYQGEDGRTKYVRFRETARINCNKCECQYGSHLECERDICIQDKDIINNINLVGHNLGWTARNYSEFWGRKYKEGLRLRLGTLEPRYKVKAMTRLTARAATLPQSFNALHEWSSLISEIKDQGWCGSSWVISTTSVASDRFAIQSKGQEAVHLSPQNILSCTRMQRGCDGGHLDAAWRYLNKAGVVNEECWPYEAATTVCKVHGRKTLAEMRCDQPLKTEREFFYKMGPAYSINNETDIMMEIMKSGPVQATMRVHRDFFSYEGGIYQPSAASRNDEHGFHAVRLVGWGEERVNYNNVKYWIAANSWGTWWGENGFFKILRGSNTCSIEDYVLASWPHVSNPYVKSSTNNRWSS